jgi:hypothetical protein
VGGRRSLGEDRLPAGGVDPRHDLLAEIRVAVGQGALDQGAGAEGGNLGVGQFDLPSLAAMDACGGCHQHTSNLPCGCARVKASRNLFSVGDKVLLSDSSGGLDTHQKGPPQGPWWLVGVRGPGGLASEYQSHCPSDGASTARAEGNALAGLPVADMDRAAADGVGGGVHAGILPRPRADVNVTLVTHQGTLPKEGPEAGQVRRYSRNSGS